MTVIPFAPINTASPAFQATVTLDGQAYNLIAGTANPEANALSGGWNLYRGDWYIALTDQSGNIVINQPLIGSPSNYPIYLFPGIFQTSTIYYQVSTSQFVVNP